MLEIFGNIVPVDIAKWSDIKKEEREVDEGGRNAFRNRQNGATAFAAR